MKLLPGPLVQNLCSERALPPLGHCVAKVKALALASVARIESPSRKFGQRRSVCLAFSLLLWVDLGAARAPLT